MNVSEARGTLHLRFRCGPLTRDSGRTRNTEDRTGAGSAQRAEAHRARPSRPRPSCCAARTCRRPQRAHLARLANTTSRAQARPPRCLRTALPGDRRTFQEECLPISTGRSIEATWRDQETRARGSTVSRRRLTAQQLPGASRDSSAQGAPTHTQPTV